MSKEVLDRLQSEMGAAILQTSDFRGDAEATVDLGQWLAVAEFLRRDEQTAMDMFTDLTAVDYPERQPETPRFDVVLMVRSLQKGHGVRLKTRVKEDQELDSVAAVWPGADWAEREVFDMFGIRFKGHPDLRRILLYDEFEGHPLRKDYSFSKTQPRLPYRSAEGIEKIPPFGEHEGKPWSRQDWVQRIQGGDLPVSPALASQQGRGQSSEGGGEQQQGQGSGEE